MSFDATEYRYRDYAQIDALPNRLKQPTNNPKGDPSFPNKLHAILHQLEAAKSSSEVACWAPHGRCFFILNRQAFVATVLQQHFHINKFTSFQRQLNYYGFKCISKGRDKGGFYHELFLYGKPGLVDHIARTHIKGMGPKRAPVAEMEPDFYRMSRLRGTKAEDTEIESNRVATREETKPERKQVSIPAAAASAVDRSVGLPHPNLEPNQSLALQSLLLSRQQWLGPGHQQQHHQQQHHQQQPTSIQDSIHLLLGAPALVAPPLRHDVPSIPPSILHLLGHTLANNESARLGLAMELRGGFQQHQSNSMLQANNTEHQIHQLLLQQLRSGGLPL